MPPSERAIRDPPTCRTDFAAGVKVNPGLEEMHGRERQELDPVARVGDAVPEESEREESRRREGRDAARPREAAQRLEALSEKTGEERKGIEDEALVRPVVDETPEEREGDEREEDGRLPTRRRGRGRRETKSAHDVERKGDEPHESQRGINVGRSVRNGKPDERFDAVPGAARVGPVERPTICEPAADNEAEHAQAGPELLAAKVVTSNQEEGRREADGRGDGRVREEEQRTEAEAEADPGPGRAAGPDERDRGEDQKRHREDLRHHAARELLDEAAGEDEAAGTGRNPRVVALAQERVKGHGREPEEDEAQDRGGAGGPRVSRGPR